MEKYKKKKCNNYRYQNSVGKNLKIYRFNSIVIKILPF
jgi:hypothetical protein